MSTYKFANLDPRPIEAAEAANHEVFETTHGVLGVEVTVPALAERCTLGNIDPQHSGGNADQAAIEAALTAELPPRGATLATVRADLDSVGAMAVISLRQIGEEMTAAMHERIAAVAKADAHTRGPWPGQRPLPSDSNPWPMAGGAGETHELAAIAAAVMDFKVTLEQRVQWMELWLLQGTEHGVLRDTYRQCVEAERTDMIRALVAGEIAISTAADDRIAVVTSTHRAAVGLGYTQAPVVIAENPAFRLGGGDLHRKLTVAAYDAGHANIKAALAELAELEAGWGGSPTIGGSPQGVSSALTTDQVVKVLAQHLK